MPHAKYWVAYCPICGRDMQNIEPDRDSVVYKCDMCEYSGSRRVTYLNQLREEMLERIEGKIRLAIMIVRYLVVVKARDVAHLMDIPIPKAREYLELAANDSEISEVPDLTDRQNEPYWVARSEETILSTLCFAVYRHREVSGLIDRLRDREVLPKPLD